jgi:hypothetical protein
MEQNFGEMKEALKKDLEEELKEKLKEGLKKDLKEELKRELDKQLEERLEERFKAEEEMREEMTYTPGKVVEALIKEETQRQFANALEESKENLCSISKKLEQISNEIEPMRLKLAELDSEVLADAVTTSGSKYFCRRQVRTGPQTSSYRAYYRWTDNSYSQ